MSSGPARHGRNEAQRTEKSPGPHCCGVPSKGVTSRNAAQPQPQDLLDLQHRDLAKRHPASRPWTGDIVAGWSRRWGRECFCKTLRAEAGILLQNSRGRGPYLLQTDSSDVKRVRLSFFAASLTRASGIGKATRLCVRTLELSCRFPSGWPLPSTRLVSFGGFIGTMNQSDSRSRLGTELWSSLALLPRQRPSWRTRPGLLGSEDGLSHVGRSSTPAERHHLAYRRRTRGLRCRETARPPRSSIFRGSQPA